MLIVDAKGVKLSESKDDVMVQKGPIYRSLLVDGNISGGYSIAVVSFIPGTKLRWHIHDSEQIIYVTEGKGIIATQKQEYVVIPGMIVVIPAGEVHYHGATKDTSFTHIAFYRGKSQVISE
jgi:quercetin dioxygenase-like cupin family protein